MIWWLEEAQDSDELQYQTPENTRKLSILIVLYDMDLSNLQKIQNLQVKIWGIHFQSTLAMNGMVMKDLQFVLGFPPEQTFLDTCDETQDAFHAYKWLKLESQQLLLCTSVQAIN
jgi:hypothetical protein